MKLRKSERYENHQTIWVITETRVVHMEASNWRARHRLSAETLMLYCIQFKHYSHVFIDENKFNSNNVFSFFRGNGNIDGSNENKRVLRNMLAHRQLHHFKLWSEAPKCSKRIRYRRSRTTLLLVNLFIDESAIIMEIYMGEYVSRSIFTRASSVVKSHCNCFT